MSEQFSLTRKLGVALPKDEPDGGSGELSTTDDPRLYYERLLAFPFQFTIWKYELCPSILMVPNLQTNR